MKIPTIYTGPDGESHFKDVEIALSSEDRPGGPQLVKGKAATFKGGDKPTTSQPMKTDHAYFLVGKGEQNGDYHPAPRRQLYVMIGGELELEVADGTTRTFKKGDFFIAEDTTGRGHLSRAKDRRALVVPLL
jgi:hypothetical protein